MKINYILSREAKIAVKQFIIKAFRALQVILNADNKVWKLPIKNRLIILDRVGSEVLAEHVLRHRNFAVLDDRGESVNVPIKLISLLHVRRYGGQRNAYKVCYLRHVGAKFAVTVIDTSKHYCDMIAHVPGCKLALVQNGSRDGSWSHNIPKNRFRADYYFTHQTDWAAYAKKYLSAKYIVSGSIIANRFPRSQHRPIKKVQWISQFRPVKSVGLKGKVHDYEDWNTKPTAFALKVVNKFCNDNKLTLEILGCGGDEGEYFYYEKLVDDFVFVKNKRPQDPYSTYKQLSNEGIVAGTDSTALRESFGRGFRTAFFSIRGHFIKERSKRFAWPRHTDDVGLFWCNVPDEEHMIQVLAYLKLVSEEEWESKVEEYRGVMHYDRGNTIIRETLRKEGVRIDD